MSVMSAISGLFPSGLPLSILLLAFPFAMVLAALSDLATMTIPNRLALALALLFLPAALAAGLDPASFALHLLAALLVLAAGILLFARGWIGGGDAKIAAAAALWLGFPGLVSFLALSALFGGFLTLGILVLRAHMLPAFALRPWILRLHDPREGIPYGVAIAAGAIAAFPDAPIFLLGAAT